MFATAESSLWSSVSYRAPKAVERPGLSREQVVGQIMSLNPSATAEFLGRFTPEALHNYLDHLVTSLAPRGTTWRRPGDTPAVVMASRAG